MTGLVALGLPSLNPSEIRRYIEGTIQEGSNLISTCESAFTNDFEMARKLGYDGEIFTGENITLTIPEAAWDNIQLGIGETGRYSRTIPREQIRYEQLEFRALLKDLGVDTWNYFPTTK
jgi:hypothetical protein